MGELPFPGLVETIPFPGEFPLDASKRLLLGNAGVGDAIQMAIEKILLLPAATVTASSVQSNDPPVIVCLPHRKSGSFNGQPAWCMHPSRADHEFS